MPGYCARGSPAGVPVEPRAVFGLGDTRTRACPLHWSTGAVGAGLTRWRLIGLRHISRAHNFVTRSATRSRTADYRGGADHGGHERAAGARRPVAWTQRSRSLSV